MARAEVHSDLQTDPENHNVENGRPVRYRRSPTRYTSSEEDELPAAHKRNKTSKSKTNPTCTLAVSQPIPSTCIPTPPIRLTISTTTPPTTPAPILTRPESAPATPITTRHVTTPTRAVTSCTLTTPLTTPRPATPVITPTTHNTRPPNGSVSAKDVQIFTLLEKIRQEQKHQTTMLSSILAKLGGVENDSEIPEDISFLIRDVEELNAFERKLNMDKNLEKLTVGHLASVGGSSVDNMGSRILKYIVANPLAEKDNWTGTKGKAFEKLSISSLLKRARRRSFREITDAKVQEIYVVFLKSVRDRDGGRKRRMKPSATVFIPDSADIPISPIDLDSDDTEDYSD